MTAVAASTLLATLLALSGAQDQTGAREAYERAIALEARGDQPAALSLLWRAAGLDPGDAEIQNRLGESLQRIGALDAAIESYRAALAARPSFRKAANNMVLALVAAGRGSESTDL